MIGFINLNLTFSVYRVSFIYRPLLLETRTPFFAFNRIWEKVYIVVIFHKEDNGSKIFVSSKVKSSNLYYTSITIGKVQTTCVKPDYTLVLV